MLAKLTGWLLLALVRLLTGAQARWWGCPPKAEQRIYFANHQSHIDLVMIWAALPDELRSITRPIAARDYWAGSRFKRWITTEVFNAIYVERQGGAAAAPAAVPAPPPAGVPERIEPTLDPAPAAAPDPLAGAPEAAAAALSDPPPAAPPAAEAPHAPTLPATAAERTEVQHELDLPAPEPAGATTADAAPREAAPADTLPPLQPDDPLVPLVEALRSGDSIIIFPEGTRGHTGVPQKFRSGLYTLARLFPEAVLVPAWIDNVQRVMPKGEVVPVPILCSVTFGAPVRLEPGEERRPFLDRAREAVIALRDV